MSHQRPLPDILLVGSLNVHQRDPELHHNIHSPVISVFGSLYVYQCVSQLHHNTHDYNRDIFVFRNLDVWRRFVCIHCFDFIDPVIRVFRPVLLSRDFNLHYEPAPQLLDLIFYKLVNWNRGNQFWGRHDNVIYWEHPVNQFTYYRIDFNETGGSTSTASPTSTGTGSTTVITESTSTTVLIDLFSCRLVQPKYWQLLRIRINELFSFGYLIDELFYTFHSWSILRHHIRKLFYTIQCQLIHGTNIGKLFYTIYQHFIGNNIGELIYTVREFVRKLFYVAIHKLILRNVIGELYHDLHQHVLRFRTCRFFVGVHQHGFHVAFNDLVDYTSQRPLGYQHFHNIHQFHFRTAANELLHVTSQRIFRNFNGELLHTISELLFHLIRQLIWKSAKLLSIICYLVRLFNNKLHQLIGKFGGKLIRKLLCAVYHLFNYSIHLIFYLLELRLVFAGSHFFLDFRSELFYAYNRKHFHFFSCYLFQLLQHRNSGSSSADSSSASSVLLQHRNSQLSIDNQLVLSNQHIFDYEPLVDNCLFPLFDFEYFYFEYFYFECFFEFELLYHFDFVNGQFIGNKWFFLGLDKQLLHFFSSQLFLSSQPFVDDHVLDNKYLFNRQFYFCSTKQLIHNWGKHLSYLVRGHVAVNHKLFVNREHFWSSQLFGPFDNGYFFIGKQLLYHSGVQLPRLFHCQLFYRPDVQLYRSDVQLLKHPDSQLLCFVNSQRQFFYRSDNKLPYYLCGQLIVNQQFLYWTGVKLFFCLCNQLFHHTRRQLFYSFSSQLYQSAFQLLSHPGSQLFFLFISNHIFIDHQLLYWPDVQHLCFVGSQPFVNSRLFVDWQLLYHSGSHFLHWLVHILNRQFFTCYNSFVRQLINFYSGYLFDDTQHFINNGFLINRQLFHRHWSQLFDVFGNHLLFISQLLFHGSQQFSFFRNSQLFCYSTRLLDFFGNWLFINGDFFGNSQLLYNRSQLFYLLRGQPIVNNILSKPSLFHQPDISELLCYSDYQLYRHHLWNLLNIRCQHVLAANQFLQLHNIFSTGLVQLIKARHANHSDPPDFIVVHRLPCDHCGVTLPGTCADLPNTNGLLPLVGVTASCLLDLGPFGVGPVAACLLNIDLLDPRGQPIADCLLRTLRGSCPGALPQPCIDLQLVNGLDLLVDLPACVAALGPYSSGATAVCLAVNSITSATTGLSIFGCLQGSFQPPPTVVTVTDPALCPPAPTPTRCATPSLPEQCLSLSTVNGLDLLVDIPACVQALGLYAVGDVATCLVTSLIDTLTFVWI
ncbi:60s ribosomal protein L19 [Colletotrichum higginsianum]|nr:60s ribosomal protein L19 [Colletotrichum higginsianum]